MNEEKTRVQREKKQVRHHPHLESFQSPGHKTLTHTTYSKQLPAAAILSTRKDDYIFIQTQRSHNEESREK